MLMEVASKDGRMRLTAKCTNAVWKANGKNDAWTIGERALAKQSMYDGPGAASVLFT